MPTIDAQKGTVYVASPKKRLTSPYNDGMLAKVEIRRNQLKLINTKTPDRQNAILFI